MFYTEEEPLLEDDEEKNGKSYDSVWQEVCCALICLWSVPVSFIALMYLIRSKHGENAKDLVYAHRFAIAAILLGFVFLAIYVYTKMYSEFRFYSLS